MTEIIRIDGIDFDADRVSLNFNGIKVGGLPVPNKEFTVFNIKGNQYRLIVSIDYEAQLIYYKYFLTHAEYDKENWKNDDYY